MWADGNIILCQIYNMYLYSTPTHSQNIIFTKATIKESIVTIQFCKRIIYNSRMKNMFIVNSIELQFLSSTNIKNTSDCTFLDILRLDFFLVFWIFIMTNIQNSKVA